MSDGGNFHVKAGCGCGAFVLLLIIIIASLGRVQFNEYAFAKAIGQPINQDKVFTQGVHFLGFWNSFVVFPADVIDLQLVGQSVFSKAEGSDAGTSLTVDVGIQYVLNPDDLSTLFDIGGQSGYILQIEGVAVEVIKNAAPDFNADSYLDNRREVEAHLFEKLAEEIADQFAGTKVINVQLMKVVFPDTFYNRKLDVGLQTISNEIQNFTREVENVRAETARKVLEIENRAKAIEQNAAANATLIETRAENEFQRLIGGAKDEGMQILANQLEIEGAQDFLSMNYLVQMLNNPGKQKKFVNFAAAPEAKSLL